MECKVIEKGEFYLVGKKIKTTSENGQNTKDITNFWIEAGRDGTIEKLCQIKGITALAGACIMEDPMSKEFDYSLCVLVDHGEAEDFKGYSVDRVYASKWAVFPSVGPMPEAIQKVWHDIFAVWLPNSSYVHGSGPELEIYPEGDTSAADYYCEVWIPVIEKAGL